MIKETAFDVLSSFLVYLLDFVKRNKIFCFSLLITTIFYFPALNRGSHDAGFLYTGDVIGYYLPALAKTFSLLSSWHFTAIDFSSFNGSSDFFLTSNFFAVHPMVVLYSLLSPVKATSIRELDHILVFMLAVHSFIACYFSLKLFTRFFSLEFGISALIAVVFAFSIQMTCALAEPPYLLSVCILPWAAYQALSYIENPNFRQLVFACFPIISGFLGGYIPLGIAALALSIVLTATKLLVLDESKSLDKRIHSFLLSLIPYACASIIISPYLYAVYEFLKETPSANTPGLFFSAHQLAEQPQDILRIFSLFYSVPGPFYEFSLFWGFITLLVFVLFIFSSKTIGATTKTDWKILKIASFIYFASVLSIYGDYSVVSDMIYYFIPQIGKMHIYQRFLLPTIFFFAVMIAIMFKALIVARPLISTRIVLIVLGVTTATSAYLVAHNPALSQKLGLNNYIVFELILGFLFVFSTIIPGKIFINVAAILLFMLPSLDRMYDYSKGNNTLGEQRKRLVVALDNAEQAKLVSYLSTNFGNKAIIKYVDITRRWTDEGIEPFPKSFPYFVLDKLKIASYSGFNFYLSSGSDYMRRMPIVGKNVVLDPDWELVANTGGDFLVAHGSDIEKGSIDYILGNMEINDLYKLPNDVVIVPLGALYGKSSFSSSKVFDNGYFKVTIMEAAKDDSNLINISKGKLTHQSSTYPGGEAEHAVDGDVDGNFKNGSVSHTERDPNAWLEIDLGKVEAIESLRIWNRTDCCGYRLRNYSVFISREPFLSSDTPLTLRKRDATWSQHILYTSNPQYTLKTDGFRGRYVRVQLGGSQFLEESYLSLAELEVFRSKSPEITDEANSANAESDIRVTRFITNDANYLQLKLESSEPAIVNYLFSNNPRLHYYLNGQRASIVEQNGLSNIIVPPGHNTIEIRYRHWPLMLFWIIYALYAIVLFYAMLPKFLIQYVIGKFLTTRDNGSNREKPS